LIQTHPNEKPMGSWLVRPKFAVASREVEDPMSLDPKLLPAAFAYPPFRAATTGP
jgi:hypothetical protein